VGGLPHKAQRLPGGNQHAGTACRVNPEERPQPRVSPRAGAASGPRRHRGPDERRRDIGVCVSPKSARALQDEKKRRTSEACIGPIWAGGGGSDGRRKARPAMNTPVVASSTTVGRFTVTCPWRGTLNNIGLFGVQTLPGCGHVVTVQQPLAPSAPRTRGASPPPGP
jgi:hypothetical protein